MGRAWPPEGTVIGLTALTSVQFVESSKLPGPIAVKSPYTAPLAGSTSVPPTMSDAPSGSVSSASTRSVPEPGER